MTQGSMQLYDLISFARMLNRMQVQAQQGQILMPDYITSPIAQALAGQLLEHFKKPTRPHSNPRVEEILTLALGPR